MKIYAKSLILILLMVGLSGCELLNLNKTKPSTQNDPVKVEQPPKIVVTDWQEILTPFTDELIATAKLEQDNMILISDAKNSSTGYVSSTQIYNILSNSLSEQDIFHIVDKKTINQAKQYLGIPYDDALVSRSKMIALARQVKADYMLFTTINQTPVIPNVYADVIMELISTQTGEIVWQFSSSQLAQKEAQ